MIRALLVSRALVQRELQCGALFSIAVLDLLGFTRLAQPVDIIALRKSKVARGRALSQWALS